MKLKKSWKEKLADRKGLPKVVRISGSTSKRWGACTVVIPAPAEADAIMKKLPEGTKSYPGARNLSSSILKNT